MPEKRQLTNYMVVNVKRYSVPPTQCCLSMNIIITTLLPALCMIMALCFVLVVRAVGVVVFLVIKQHCCRFF